MKHFILTINIFLFTSNCFSQTVILNDSIYCINNIRRLESNKMLLSVKTQTSSFVPNNELWLFETANDTIFTLLVKLENIDTNIFFWSSHSIFQDKVDTITVLGTYFNQQDSSVGLITLLLNTELNIIKKNLTKLSLPITYPSIKFLNIPFKVQPNFEGGYYGSLTLKNNKDGVIHESFKPAIEVLFEFDEYLNLKYVSQIVSDSFNLGPYFLLSDFDILNLLKKEDGKYLLNGENGLLFSLDSTLKTEAYTATPILEAKPIPKGQVSYKKNKQSFISLSLTIKDSSNLNNFPQNGIILLYNLLRINIFDPTLNSIKTQQLIDLPNNHDSAYISIIKNSEVVFNNNLSISNPYIESFDINNNNEFIFGYHHLSGMSKENYGGEFNLIFIDSNYLIIGYKNFLENYQTEITSLFLEANGNAWVCGYQTRGINPDGKLKRTSYLKFVKKSELLAGLNHLKTALKYPTVIYPNPATKVIKIMNIPNESIIRIYNLAGKILIENRFENTNNDGIDIDKLDNGIYLLEITTNNDIRIWSRFIKNSY